MHLELDDAGRRLYLMQHLLLLLRRHVLPRYDQVDEDSDAGERCHQVVADRRVQHLQHLVIVRLLFQFLAARNVPQA